MNYNMKVFLFLLSTITFSQQPSYPWLTNGNLTSLEKITDITTPAGFKRTQTNKNSFAYWLRNLPLKSKGNPVYLYNGKLKANQSAHFRVINIDIGTKDLQQCADAVIRLRGEYLYSQNKTENIHFNFTSGDTAKLTEWFNGVRPEIKNNQVKWTKKSSVNKSYGNFKSYLETVFIYAGSYSLKKELLKVNNLMEIQTGDVFIQGGFPGHAIIVVDLAQSIENNKIAVMLAQSYMPAQEIHVLKNPNNINSNPWYVLKEDKKLYTPEWTFDWSDLYRFRHVN